MYSGPTELTPWCFLRSYSWEGLWEIASGDGASSSLARRSSVWPRSGAPSPLVTHNSSLPGVCRVFEGNLKAKAIGTWGALSAIAMAVGPLLGGWLVEEVSWRAAFLINPLLAAVAIPIAMRSEERRVGKECR